MGLQAPRTRAWGAFVVVGLISPIAAILVAQYRTEELMIQYDLQLWRLDAVQVLQPQGAVGSLLGGRCKCT